MVSNIKISEKEQESDTKVKEPHHNTQLRAGIIASWNYKRLTRSSKDDDSDHSAIASSQSCAFSRQKKMTSHMVDRSNNIDQRMEAQECLIQNNKKLSTNSK